MPWTPWLGAVPDEPYFTSRHKTPWGVALDLSLAPVRRYFVENARRWVAWFDGLRLDAVHGILDDSPRHILQEIAAAVHADGGLCIAESDLNDPRLIEQYGLDASWADDFHHALHVALTGESQGYYADYQDPMPKLVAALERGWFYEGQYKPGWRGNRRVEIYVRFGEGSYEEVLQPGRWKIVLDSNASEFAPTPDARPSRVVPQGLEIPDRDDLNVRILWMHGRGAVVLERE